MLPLILACVSSYLVTSLLMPRSILTERLGRRGYHLSREYGVDPLEMVSVADVMKEPASAAGDVEASDPLEASPDIFAYADETCRAVAEEMAVTGVAIMPVMDRETGAILGTIRAQDVLSGRKRAVERELERSNSFQIEMRPR
jgi:predicted transcriptional regulator